MKEVDSESGLNQILGSNKNTVAVFLADWCPFCRTFEPIFVKKMAEIENWEKLIVHLEDEDNPLWDKYGIEVIPTVIFFEENRIVLRLDGMLGVGLREKELVEVLKKLRK